MKKLKINLILEFDHNSSPEAVIGQFLSFISLSEDVMVGRKRGNVLSHHFWRERLKRNEKRSLLYFISKITYNLKEGMKKSNPEILKEEDQIQNEQIVPTVQKIISRIKSTRISDPTKDPHQASMVKAIQAGLAAKYFNIKRGKE